MKNNIYIFLFHSCFIKSFFFIKKKKLLLNYTIIYVIIKDLVTVNLNSNDISDYKFSNYTYSVSGFIGFSGNPKKVHIFYVILFFFYFIYSYI